MNFSCKEADRNESKYFGGQVNVFDRHFLRRLSPIL